MPNNKVLQCLIMLTQDCNLRCSFCFEKKVGYNAEHSISYDNLKKIVDFCNEADVKYIIFSGGEPLLYPNLIDILQYIRCNYPAINTTIATNGIILSDLKLCKLLVDNGISYIDLSIKGSNSKEWELVTGYDGSDQQLQAINNLSSLPVEFSCSMVITPQNALTFCHAVQTAYNNGARQFSFTFIIDNDDNIDKDRIYLSNHNPLELINNFFSQLDNLNSITQDWWIEYSFPMCIYSEEQLILLSGKLAAPCYVHMRDAIIIDPDMNLLPCDMYPQYKLGLFGTDFSSYQQFKVLSSSSNYRNMMDLIDKLPSSECKDCNHLAICFGGCPVLWKNYSFKALKKFKEDTK